MNRLNMPHDDDQKCVDFSNDGAGEYESLKESDSQFEEDPVKDVSYVMSRMLDHNTNPWEWSKCSRNYVTAFLE